MTPHGTAKDDLLIAAIAGGKSVDEAVKLCGFSRRTIFRRLKDDAIQSRVREARSQMFSETVGQLAGLGTEAAETLRSLLGARAETVRLGAARAALELGARLHEKLELEQRIIALEDLVDET